jgi:hypothetical protein
MRSRQLARRRGDEPEPWLQRLVTRAWLGDLEFAWREASGEATAALAAWRQAPGAMAYAVYRAAADRADAAHDDFAAAVHGLRDVPVGR